MSASNFEIPGPCLEGSVKSRKLGPMMAPNGELKYGSHSVKIKYCGENKLNDNQRRLVAELDRHATLIFYGADIDALWESISVYLRAEVQKLIELGAVLVNADCGAVYTLFAGQGSEPVTATMKQIEHNVHSHTKIADGCMLQAIQLLSALGIVRLARAATMEMDGFIGLVPVLMSQVKIARLPTTAALPSVEELQETKQQYRASLTENYPIRPLIPTQTVFGPDIYVLLQFMLVKGLASYSCHPDMIFVNAEYFEAEHLLGTVLMLPFILYMGHLKTHTLAFPLEADGPFSFENLALFINMHWPDILPTHFDDFYHGHLKQSSILTFARVFPVLSPLPPLPITPPPPTPSLVLSLDQMLRAASAVPQVKDTLTRRSAVTRCPKFTKLRNRPVVDRHGCDHAPSVNAEHGNISEFPSSFLDTLPRAGDAPALPKTLVDQLILTEVGNSASVEAASEGGLAKVEVSKDVDMNLASRIPRMRQLSKPTIATANAVSSSSKVRARGPLRVAAVEVIAAPLRVLVEKVQIVDVSATLVVGGTAPAPAGIIVDRVILEVGNSSSMQAANVGGLVTLATSEVAERRPVASADLMQLPLRAVGATENAAESSSRGRTRRRRRRRRRRRDKQKIHVDDRMDSGREDARVTSTLNTIFDQSLETGHITPASVSVSPRPHQLIVSVPAAILVNSFTVGHAPCVVAKRMVSRVILDEISDLALPGAKCPSSPRVADDWRLATSEILNNSDEESRLSGNVKASPAQVLSLRLIFDLKKVAAHLESLLVKASAADPDFPYSLHARFASGEVESIYDLPAIFSRVHSLDYLLESPFDADRKAEFLNRRIKKQIRQSRQLQRAQEVKSAFSSALQMFSCSAFPSVAAYQVDLTALPRAPLHPSLASGASGPASRMLRSVNPVCNGSVCRDGNPGLSFGSPIDILRFTVNLDGRYHAPRVFAEHGNICGFPTLASLRCAGSGPMIDQVILKDIGNCSSDMGRLATLEASTVQLSSQLQISVSTSLWLCASENAVPASRRRPRRSDLEMVIAVVCSGSLTALTRGERRRRDFPFALLERCVQFAVKTMDAAAEILSCGHWFDLLLKAPCHDRCKALVETAMLSVAVTERRDITIGTKLIENSSGEEADLKKSDPPQEDAARGTKIEDLPIVRRLIPFESRVDTSRSVDPPTWSRYTPAVSRSGEDEFAVASSSTPSLVNGKSVAAPKKKWYSFSFPRFCFRMSSNATLD